MLEPLPLFVCVRVGVCVCSVWGVICKGYHPVIKPRTDSLQQNRHTIHGKKRGGRGGGGDREEMEGGGRRLGGGGGRWEEAGRRWRKVGGGWEV